MTRQEMAEQLERDADSGDFGYGGAVELMRVAAAELRTNCAGCEHFWVRHFNPRTTDGICDKRNAFVPLDGTGFCHEWSAK
jgi:hypothetical protein